VPTEDIFPAVISQQGEGMKSDNSNDSTTWLAVIGRSLAYLCLRNSELRDKDLATQAALLISLGLGVEDSAKLLGTTEASLRELLRLARNKAKGGSHGSKKTKKR
jgi:hypothetical protein